MNIYGNFTPGQECFSHRDNIKGSRLEQVMDNASPLQSVSSQNWIPTPSE